ncbi:MAG: hypothetical protein OQK95_15105 [Gammaproteobacteria bacterium]|nr:hypothetical protein [Gammaproteobacteria bacterium]
MKRIIITLVVLIGLIAGGAYFLFLKAITPEDLPAKVMNAEEAIATSGTIAITSVDMTYVRHIESMFKQMNDPSPLPVSKSDESKEEKTFLEKLKEQGVHLVSDTDYALATLNVAEEKPAHTVVLFGRFSQAKLKKAIAQYYAIDEGTDGYWLITQNIEQDKKSDPCADPAAKKPAPKQHALHIKNDRIILSGPEMMPVLLKRFAANARAEISLTKWRAFRKEKAVAGAFMTPKEAKKGAVDLPSALLLGALSNQPLTDIYAGAVVSFLPSPGFTLLVDAHAIEAAWPLEVKTKYDAWLNEALAELKEMPTLASLLQALSVQADGNILRFKTVANRKTLDNLEKVPGEFLQMAFSGAFGDGTKEGDTGTEQIVSDSDVENYIPQFAFASVQPFDVKDAFHKPDHVVGPLAVRLERFGLLATDNSIIELTINAEGKGFDNLSVDHMHQSNETPVASLSITGVEDKDGNDLLREELCGKTRNLVAESLSTIRDKEYVNGQWLEKSIKVSGKKSVRLKPNVPVSKISKIKGKMSIRAATRTSVVKLQLPFSGKTIETDKVRMYLQKNTPSTVKYTLSGDMSYIMAVRAKNAKGQYLASASSSASGKGTKMVSKRFKGKVASIEVVVAGQMKSQDYPFEINQVTPRYGKKGNGKQVDVMFTSKSQFLKEHARVKYQDECKDKQKVALGVFLVCLNKFGDQWGQKVGGDFDVIAPYGEALLNDLSAGVLSIDSVITESGEEIAFDKNEKADFDYKFDTNYNKVKKDWEIINRRLHAAYVKVFSDKEELKNKKVSMVKGSLTVRFPKQPKYFELDADELGVIKKTENGIVANISAFEDWNTYIDIQGPVDKVVRFMPLAKDGSILTTMNDRINEKQYHTWGMSKEDKEKIKLLPKKWLGMTSIYGKPEVIRIFYADDFEIIKHPFQFSLKE